MAHALICQKEHPNEHDSRLLDDCAICGRSQLDCEGATSVEGASTNYEHNRQEENELVSTHLLIRLLEVIDVTIDALVFAERAG